MTTWTINAPWPANAIWRCSGGWYSVALRFKHPGYVSFMTNYTPANATNTAGREPLVNAGDILLVPLSR